MADLNIKIADVEQNLTPLELLEKAIVAYGVDDYVRRGPDSEYGLATLEALRDLCREYMSDCALRGVPATQADFILYFSEAEKEGASAAGGDCIQVMTYHKAKGLEWPIVILCSLDEACCPGWRVQRSSTACKSDAAVCPCSIWGETQRRKWTFRESRHC